MKGAFRERQVSPIHPNSTSLQKGKISQVRVEYAH